LKYVTSIGIIYLISKRRDSAMNKKHLKTLTITLSLVVFLLTLGLQVLTNEDPPLRGENINIGYHIC